MIIGRRGALAAQTLTLDIDARLLLCGFGGHPCAAGSAVDDIALRGGRGVWGLCHEWEMGGQRDDDERQAMAEKYVYRFGSHGDWGEWSCQAEIFARIKAVSAVFCDLFKAVA